ncbi:hypothetical protein B0H17DRAFT_1034274 [Mycena rosella]|uniref:C2H2-type domain-containing protein n=1 Tax=Mycena rosella TaxID=1033263 RepID=A0AAD7GW85_MYCRO|nr:hypothetical protein B0H17DRAFT_1034274 [Mycena rosella]
MPTAKMKLSRMKITISPETIVELAKSVLVPVQCDTLVPNSQEGAMVPKMVPCGQRICCWKAFHKHQLKHCGSRKKNHSGVVHYLCRLNKCSAKLHTSGASLKSHIELSHLKNLPLPCPFTTCDPVISELGRAAHIITFSRSRDLLSHLEEAHADLIGRELDVCSKLLQPRWEPCPPYPLPVPPPLPYTVDIPPAAPFGNPIIVHPTLRLTRLISSGSSTLPASHAPKSPRRRKMLRAPDPRDASPPDLHSRDLQYDFADLPKVEFNQKTGSFSPNILDAPHFRVRPIGEGLPRRRELVRPPPLREVPVVETPPPPASIFHDVLHKQVMTEYALGASAAADATFPVQD